MTCSSETSHGVPCAAASAATARIIGVGPQTYSRTSLRARHGRQRRVERCGDVPACAAAPVFGGQHDVDAEPFEQLDVVQLGGAARAVEQRVRRAARLQRLGERDERREADAARDHPGFRRRIDRLERPAERSETADARARLGLVEQCRCRRRCAC